MAGAITPDGRHFQTAYDELERSLVEQAVGTRLCDSCVAGDMLNWLAPYDPDVEPPSGFKFLIYGSISDLSSRSSCPVCRFLWKAIRDGNKNCCTQACHKPIPSLENDSRLEEELVIQLRLPKQRELGWIETQINGMPIDRHISFGRIRSLHPTYADHERIKQWITTCQQEHDSCNEHHSTGAKPLYGNSRESLRLIDVKSRLIVQTQHSVPYVTISYVWGDTTTRTFEERIVVPGSYDLGNGVYPMENQPTPLLEGSLPQTFEDAIVFTAQLGERYLWIDALCIPQNEPDITSQHISQMDNIYSASVCTLVSLNSGVEAGLPGSSLKSPRHVDQYAELLPEGVKIASPLINLSLEMETSPWPTRAWTLQEHLLSRRTLFFGRQEVSFVCGKMTTRESRIQPHDKEHNLDEDSDLSDDDWADYSLPLPVATPQQTLRKSYQDCVMDYSGRDLTFPSDRLRAFEGLQARLSKLYDVEFVHALPIDSSDFIPSLLWRHSYENPNLVDEAGSPPSVLRQWPHWSWLSHPGGVHYRPCLYWSHRRSFAKHINLPDPQAWYQGVKGQFHPLSDMRGISIEERERVRVLKLSGLALDIDITQWSIQHGGGYRYPEMEIWLNPVFPTVRGPITFHIGMVVDDQQDGKHHLPPGTRYIRLIRLNPKDRPKAPWALVLDKPHEVLKPLQSELSSSSTADEHTPKSETEMSSQLDWVSRVEGDRDPVEEDSSMLVVEVTPAGVATRRLGIAYVRMIDFLVAGAETKEFILGDG